MSGRFENNNKSRRKSIMLRQLEYERMMRLYDKEKHDKNQKELRDYVMGKHKNN